MLFLRSHGGENHTNQAFFHVSPVPENISLQCSGSTENAAKRRRLFSGSTKLFKTKTCQNLELLLGDLFEVGKKLSNEIVQNATER